MKEAFPLRKRVAAFLLAVLLLLAAFPASAGSELGQTYADFVDLYSANLTFINQNTGRHLIPLSMSKSNDTDSHRLYSIPGDVLSCTIRMDITGTVIESCTITVTAPEGMSYGDGIYYDFCTSCYHSYALEMAMTSYPDALDRYAVVQDIEEGLKLGNGVFKTQVGYYSLTCLRTANSVSIAFVNGLFEDSSEEEVFDDTDDTEEPVDLDESESEEEDAYVG